MTGLGRGTGKGDVDGEAGEEVKEREGEVVGKCGADITGGG